MTAASRDPGLTRGWGWRDGRCTWSPGDACSLHITNTCSHARRCRERKREQEKARDRVKGPEPPDIRQLKAHFHSRPQASVLASPSHRQSSGAVIRHSRDRAQVTSRHAMHYVTPEEVLLQEGRTPGVRCWGAASRLARLLFSLFRTLFALFLISAVSCSRSSLVSG